MLDIESLIARLNGPHNLPGSQLAVDVIAALRAQQEEIAEEKRQHKISCDLMVKQVTRAERAEAALKACERDRAWNAECVKEAEAELEAARKAGKSLYDASQQLIAERDALLRKLRYYEESLCAGDMLTMLDGGMMNEHQQVKTINPERVADVLRERDALRKHLQSATERRTGFNPDTDAARAKEQK